MLQELEIKNFKSIKHLEINPARINVFIGKPNAGKSNLLEALAFLGNGVSKSMIRFTDLPSLFYDQNYDNAILVASGNKVLTLENSKTAQQFVLKSFDSKIHYMDLKDKNVTSKNVMGHTMHTSKTTGKQINKQTSQVSIDGNIIGGYQLAASNIRKYDFKGIAPQINDNVTYLKPDASNLWGIIRHNSFLKEFSSEFFKDFSLEVLFDVRNNRMDIMRRSEGTYYLIDFSMTPDTFQRMLYHLAAMESNRESVILFEEPEAQSYPPYIQMLAEKIVDDNNNQYFITTHSPFIVEKMLERAENIEGIKFFVTYFEDFQTKVHELSTKEIKHVTSNSVDLFFNMEAFQK